MHALDTQEYGKLEQLKDHEDAYATALSALRTLRVPASLENFHISTLNYLSKFKLAVEFMRNAEQDPILAMLAIIERAPLEDEFKIFLAESQQKIISEHRNP